MVEFVKAEKRIIVKPEGLDYVLDPNKIYDLRYDNYQGISYFEENGELNMPKKIYEFEEDTVILNRITTYFNSDKSSQTTGVLLSGNKGTGKTVFAKRLAVASKLPTIIVNNEFPAWKLNDFFKTFKTPTCIIFDEIEKNERYWKTKDILGFLDGIQATAKKLVILTCNKTDNLDDNLFDRCSRIRYHRKYIDNSNIVFIKNLVLDKGVKDANTVIDFITKNMKVLSFDNISCFLDEVLLFEEMYSLKDIASLMNLSTNKETYKDFNEEEEDDTEDDYVEHNLKMIEI